MNLFRRLISFGILVYWVEADLLDKGGVIHQFGGKLVHRHL